MQQSGRTYIAIDLKSFYASVECIFGKQTKLRDLDANLLKQGVRKIECYGDNVRVVLKNNQVLEERDQA